MNPGLDTKVYVRKPLYQKNKLGDPETKWLSPAPVQMSFQPAGGRLLLEMYGARLAYMLISYIAPDLPIEVGDGLCLEVARDREPDYLVVACYTYPRHIKLLIEKR